MVRRSEVMMRWGRGGVLHLKLLSCGLRRLRRGCLIAIVGTVACCGSDNPAESEFTTRTITLLDETVEVAPGEYETFRFRVVVDDEVRNVLITGGFVVTRGGEKEIVAYVLDDDEFYNYQNRKAFKALYDSRPVTSVEFTIPIPSTDTYHVVFDNTFSPTVGKTVAALIIMLSEERVKSG